MPPSPCTPLPADIADFKSSHWEELKPWFDELMAVELSPTTLPGFLRQQSDLDACVSEAANRLYVATCCDTTDAAKERAFLDYQASVAPPLEQAYQALQQKLLASGLSLPGLERPLQRMRAWTANFREENLPLVVELGALENRFNQWSSAFRVDFEGAPRTGTEMARVLEDPDRARREAGWRGIMATFAQGRAQLDETYDAMLQRRHRLALNAGYERYTEYRFQEFGRFDYTPADCLALHDALALTAVPLARRVAALRARGLGLAPEALRPWDLELDGLSAQAPQRQAGAPTLAEGVTRIFEASCPQTLPHFRRLLSLGTLDLEDRPGKRLAGFCSPYERSGSCFIYMTANGTPWDALTLVHEAGHAMHFMQAQRRQPYGMQAMAPFECCEGVAMSQELLALPHLGVFYGPQEAALVALRQLLQIPQLLGYICAIDGFQHWAYAHPDASHAQRDQAADALQRRFSPAQGWEGFPQERASFWHRKQHVFNSAFYYIEYAMAQLFALQVWRQARRDPAAAANGLVAAMGLGGTVGIPEFHAAAGAQFRLNAPFLAELMAELEAAINEGLAALGQAPLPA